MKKGGSRNIKSLLGHREPDDGDDADCAILSSASLFYMSEWTQLPHTRSTELHVASKQQGKRLNLHASLQCTTIATGDLSSALQQLRL